ncbi:MAG: DUF748 domain-containing protein [Halieaceae bacterium]|jgi:hypothetical protein|nr:DUF748 domain-containing protein [Halieaceae bacterium]
MKPIARRLLKALGFLYLAYLALSLLIILPLMNIMAPRLAKDAIDRELRSELLLFNPFNLSVEARGLSLTEDDGHRPLAFRRLLVDLSIASLWQPGIVLDRLWLDDLELHVLRYADGSFHFDDLLEGDDSDADSSREDSAAAALPAFTLHDLRLGAHLITYTDRTRSGPYETVQRDFELHTSNLSTVPGEEGQSRLELTSDGGGALRWSGLLDLSAGRSSGELELVNIDLTPAWRYEAEKLDFVASSARFDLRLSYRGSWGSQLQLLIDDGEVALHDIDVAAADEQRHPETYVRLGDMRLAGIGLDLAARRVEADSLRIQGLDVSGFDEDGAVSLVDIFSYEGAESANADSPAAETPDDDPDPRAEDEWSLSLGELSLDDSALRWATPMLSPERMEVSPISVSVSDIDWPASQRSRIELGLRINATTQIDLSGDLNLGSGDGELELQLEGWMLPWLDPLIQEQLRTQLRRGRLDANASLRLSSFNPDTAGFSFSVDDFATVLEETGEEAFSLRRLAIDDGELSMTEELLRIGSISLDGPAGSLHIDEDGRINVNGVLRERADTQGANEDTTASAASTASAWRVLLDRVVLNDGRLDFADDSLPLPFSTRIENIEAEIADIDSLAETPLNVTLNGNIDGYAPVVIEGSGTPHGERADGELAFRFRGMDIATMSPYSGTYAGYTIDSGTLSLDLRYALAGQAIEGDNRVVISQMRLGEPIESDLAVEVPLKLGLALLTDAKGVIDLAVPVSGNVDDPQFSLGKIIGRAFMNVITKAVTAPFKLLAGLVGSDRNLEMITFAAGSTALDETAAAALDDLARALAERPQLTLLVGGSAAPGSDADALRRAALRQSLIDGGLESAAIENRDERWLEVVTARYAELAAASAADEEASEEDSEAAAEIDADTMWEALVAATQLPRGALEALGSERAAAAKRHLVTVGSIDAARISINYDITSADSAAHMEVGS